VTVGRLGTPAANSGAMCKWLFTNVKYLR